MQQGLNSACFQFEKKFLMASTWSSLHSAVQATCINAPFSQDITLLLMYCPRF